MKIAALLLCLVVTALACNSADEGGGGAGGEDSLLCPAAGTYGQATEKANQLVGTECEATEPCSLIAACDSCELRCVNDKWQIDKCDQAGPAC